MQPNNNVNYCKFQNWNFETCQKKKEEKKIAKMKELLHCFHGEQSFFHFRWNSQAEGMFQDGLRGQKVASEAKKKKNKKKIRK